MTRAKRRFGPAGRWTFQSALGSVVSHDRASLEKLIDLLSRAAHVLEHDELLRPREVIFHDWLSVKGETRSPEPDTHVAVTRAADIVEASRAVLDEREHERGFRRIGNVQIVGTGLALDATGQPHVVEDLAWLYGFELDCYYVEVCTQSDVWMPYTFLATHQPEIAQRNAPRLEAALRGVESALGLACDSSDNRTRFAVPRGYKLVNLGVDDGDEPIAVADPDFYLEPA
jgi:hypothetical protein